MQDTLLDIARTLEDYKEPTLIERGKRLHNKQPTLLSKSQQIQTKEFDLLGRANELLKKEKLNKENQTMLEKAFEINSVSKKTKKNKNPVIDTTVKVKEDLVVPYSDKFDKLLHYAEKYKIPFSKAGAKKSYIQIANDVHKHEMKFKKELIKNGLDRTYKEYGHYINIV